MTDPIDWLLADDVDPAIRYQTMRDLTHAAPDAVAAERARLTAEGWAADLLAAQDAEGRWGHGPEWVSWSGTWRDTLYTPWLLADMGVDPGDPRVRQMVTRLRDGVDWGEEFGNTPFFAGETEECTNGLVLKAGGYLAEIDPGLVDDALIDRLLGDQLDDGGWNCDAPESARASFHSTICVLEGLLEAERAGAARAADLTEARHRGEQYLLDRHLYRSLRTGAEIDPSWSLFTYAYSWHYDVLRGLEHLRKAGVTPDDRAADAIALLESKRNPDGTWNRDSPESYRVRYGMEADGEPSRWNTLRALRVLDWFRG